MPNIEAPGLSHAAFWRRCRGCSCAGSHWTMLWTSSETTCSRSWSAIPLPTIAVTIAHPESANRLSKSVSLFGVFLKECSSRSVSLWIGAEGLDGPLQDLRTEAANLCGMCTLCSPHCFGHRSRVGTLHTPRGLVVPLGLRTTLRRNFAEQPDSKLPAGWAPSCSALTLVTAPFFAPGGLPSLLCKSHDQNTVMLIKCGRAAARSGFQSR